MATLVRFREPFREIAALQNEMTRLMGGLLEDKISVELEDNALTVSGERERSGEVAGERFYRFERRFGSFTRTIGLPQGTDENSIKADYKDGVLEIHVPKPEEPKPRRIQIGGGSQATIEGSTTEEK